MTYLNSLKSLTKTKILTTICNIITKLTYYLTYLTYFNSFDEQEDKYLLCLLFKYGFGNWNQIRNHIFEDPLMKFNFNMKVK